MFFCLSADVAWKNQTNIFSTNGFFCWVKMPKTWQIELSRLRHQPGQPHGWWAGQQEQLGRLGGTLLSFKQKYWLMNGGFPRRRGKWVSAQVPTSVTNFLQRTLEGKWGPWASPPWARAVCVARGFAGPLSPGETKEVYPEFFQNRGHAEQSQLLQQGPCSLVLPKLVLRFHAFLSF